uniref:Uncharacterized protein n=1 Tax=Sphaerodactylus townsendi TaxID=933632 RepID=A0ACB8FVN3_9SAUR
MSCYYTVQFIPEHLANYEDYVLVETQSPYPLVVPLEARRPPPILTLPEVLDCGACLVGGVKFSEYLCRNEGTSSGKFCIMPKGTWPPPHFQAVATFGFVEQESFGIQPAVFELFPGQSVVIELAVGGLGRLRFRKQPSDLEPLAPGLNKVAKDRGPLAAILTVAPDHRLCGIFFDPAGSCMSDWLGWCQPLALRLGCSTFTISYTYHYSHKVYWKSKQRSPFAVI